MSMNSSTPVVESLTYRGATSGAYSVTSGSTTSIYVKKSEAYDQLGVLEFLKDSYNLFTVTWKNEFVSSLPSGYKTATQVFSPGTANTAQVLTGYTFSSANGTNLSGTMPNRGNLNWSGSNTTYSVPAGYYSGGTLDSRTSYNNGYNAGNSAGQITKRNNITLQKIGPSDDDIKHATYTFSASSGRCYIAAMAGDPGAFQNFGISGATLLSNIYCGDTPPNGTEFARMISFRANGGNVTITWNSGSYQPYMILALVN